jgi:hypothetical protein
MGLLSKLIPQASPKRFAKMMLAELQRGGLTDARIDEENFAIRVGEFVLNLSNAYQDSCNASPLERRKVIQAYAKLPTETPDVPDAWAEAKAHVLPRVRERFYHESSVTGAGNPEGLAAMAAIAEDAVQDTRGMSGVPVVLSGMNWVPFVVPAAHPAAVALRRVERIAFAIQYRQQGEALDRIFQKAGEDRFVADYNLVERKKDSSLVSWTVWIEGADNALMPRADRVHFASDTVKAKGWARWEDIETHFSDLLEPEKFYPVRYRIRSFPTPERLARLHLRSIDQDQ